MLTLSCSLAYAQEEKAPEYAAEDLKLTCDAVTRKSVSICDDVENADLERVCRAGAVGRRSSLCDAESFDDKVLLEICWAAAKRSETHCYGVEDPTLFTLCLACARKANSMCAALEKSDDDEKSESLEE